MAIVLDEPEASACADCLAQEADLAISAGTLAEALIVAGRRNVRPEMERLVEGLGLDVVDLTAPRAQRVSDAYERWGKGAQRAGLNFSDCFAYALAQERNSPLLFVGDDFERTDITPATSLNPSGP